MPTRCPGPLPLDMHHPDAEDAQVLRQLTGWALRRLARRGQGGAPKPAARQLASITEQGIGTRRAWDELRERVLPSAFPTDHPGYLAFVPGAPSVAAVLADMAVSASGVYAGSELEAGAVVTAERAALRWLADLAGLPAAAHGTFVSGGSMANLSALVAARHAVRERTGRRPQTVIAGAAAHSSVASAADIMGCDVHLAGDAERRFEADDLRAALAGVDLDDVVAVVATAGATNTGCVDDLAGLVAVCREYGLWLHVDAAYGGAALLAERTRGLFAGLGDVDSVTMDPHKWFFTPFDCAAVLYADPDRARRAHTQQASYLSATADGDNPSDYAVHLTRRARGLPLWMSLVANGAGAYRDAVNYCLDLAEHAAQQIEGSEHLELVGDPSLSVVLFRRRGWEAEHYIAWSAAARAVGVLITPTSAQGAPALRLCFVNPVLAKEQLDTILADLDGWIATR